MEQRPDGTPIGRPFQKGVSPNPSGRPKGLRNSKKILAELLQVTEKVLNPVTNVMEEVDQLEIMWAQQVVKAKGGDGLCFDRIVSRLEGGAEQKTTNTNLNVTATAEELKAAPASLIQAMAKLIKVSAGT